MKGIAMKWFESLIIELCLRPCWKLGNSAFWERLLLGKRSVQMQDRFETLPSTERFGRGDNTELIEIRTEDASSNSGSRARIAILAVKAPDSDGDKHAAKKEYSR